MNPPLPITRMKIPKDRWLNQKVKYEENLTLKNILEDMNDKTYEWILSQNDLSLITEYDSYKEDFINLMYNYELKNNHEMDHMTETEEDLYDLKYLEDINNLFLELKKLDDYYDTNIIQGDFNEYFEFIKRITNIQEFGDYSSEEDLIEL